MGTDCMIDTVMVLDLLESLRSRDGLSKNNDTVMVLDLLESLRSRDGLSKNKPVNIVSSITAQRNDQSTIILTNE